MIKEKSEDTSGATKARHRRKKGPGRIPYSKLPYRAGSKLVRRWYGEAAEQRYNS